MVVRGGGTRGTGVVQTLVVPRGMGPGRVLASDSLQKWLFSGPGLGFTAEMAVLTSRTRIHCRFGCFDVPDPDSLQIWLFSRFLDSIGHL